MRRREERGVRGSGRRHEQEVGGMNDVTTDRMTGRGDEETKRRRDSGQWKTESCNTLQLTIQFSLYHITTRWTL